VKRHEEGQRCLELFKPYCIGKQILESDSTLFLTFAIPWNLLNFWRACGTGFGVSVQISGDVTSKAFTTALNILVFAVNRLGSHAVPLSSTLISAECKSSAAYVQAWRALKNAMRILKKFLSA
jgi:hypothetical protein